MSGRDLDAFRRAALESLAGLGAALAAVDEAEAALRLVTDAVFELLGDRSADLVPGALKQGETQFFVAGFFLVLPEATGHVLVAERGFPAEQHRLRIPIDTGHPGRVYQTRSALLLADTDEHGDFKQILKTARMGSTLYGPMTRGAEMMGQLIMAARARHTFSEPDLIVLRAFAALAAEAFLARDGTAFLAALQDRAPRQAR